MNYWYSRVLEPLLRGPTKNLIEFLHTKGVLNRYVKCILVNKIWELDHTLEIEMEWRLGFLTIGVLTTVNIFLFALNRYYQV
ncbi:hypothetical protein HERIO_2587 [Hepatospora eriocheir]|uniref:Uncharacterized protein n=1 Tax=Hepatospora eriocheir TaxID=1081669 RepID=A0A1X0Q6C2_9MICR|nr:hypothetical protein HERIO_2587 [Hepatospora eriocheir]